MKEESVADNYKLVILFGTQAIEVFWNAKECIIISNR